MNKEELMEKVKAQEESLDMTRDQVVEAYFKGEEVPYQPYSLNGPDFAICNYFGHKISELFVDPEVQKKVGEEKAKMGFNDFVVFLEGKMVAALVGSGLDMPPDDIPKNSSQVLKDYKDFDKIKDYDFVNSDLYKNAIAGAKAFKAENPKAKLSAACNGPITFAGTIRPIDLILRDMRKDPDNVHMLMDWVTDTILDYVRLYYKEIGEGDLEFMEPIATTDLISPKQFREFVLPYLKRMVDETRKVGNGVNCHICGRTKGIWEDLGTLDLKSFSVDNIEDMGELKETLGGKLIISGNIPPVDVLRYGTIDEVIESVKSTLAKASDSPKGFILDAGCMITPGTPRENLWALIYAVREYGSDAKIGRLPKGLEK